VHADHPVSVSMFISNCFIALSLRSINSISIFVETMGRLFYDRLLENAFYSAACVDGLNYICGDFGGSRMN
jgi:hypothetical protein